MRVVAKERVKKSGWGSKAQKGFIDVQGFATQATSSVEKKINTEEVKYIALELFQWRENLERDFEFKKVWQNAF